MLDPGFVGAFVIQADFAYLVLVNRVPTVGR